jgi:hypothetical protein
MSNPDQSDLRFWTQLLEGLVSMPVTRDQPNDEPTDDDFSEIHAIETDHEVCSCHQNRIQLGQRLHLLEWVEIADQRNLIPGNASESLRFKSRAQRMKTWQRNQELREVIESIDRREPAPYAWLKGADLLRENVYPAGTRRMSDIDLLLMREDIGEWTRYLEQLGFSAHRAPGWVKSTSFDRSVSSTRFFRKDGQQTIILDAHWHLVDFPARRKVGTWDYDIGSVWKRVDNHRLSVEDHFLYMVDHAFTHSFRRWKWFVDIGVILRSRSLDPERLDDRVNRWNLGRVMRLCDETFRSITGQNLVPDESLRGSGEGITSAESRFISRSSQAESGTGDYLKICLGMIDDWSSKIQFLMNILWPPPAAIPNLSAPPSVVEATWIYARRTLRVVRKGWKILTRV